MRSLIFQSISIISVSLSVIALPGCGALMIWDLQKESMRVAIERQRMITEVQKMQLEEHKRQAEERIRQAEIQRQQNEMAIKWYNSLTQEQKYEIMMEEKKLDAHARNKVQLDWDLYLKCSKDITDIE
jgi:hypothetical protein